VEGTTRGRFYGKSRKFHARSVFGGFGDQADKRSGNRRPRLVKVYAADPDGMLIESEAEIKGLTDSGVEEHAFGIAPFGIMVRAFEVGVELVEVGRVDFLSALESRFEGFLVELTIDYERSFTRVKGDVGAHLRKDG